MAVSFLSIVPAFLNLRFRFLDFLVRMWLACDFAYTTLPFPVTLKRFAAPLFVFIFGIFFSPNIP